MRTGVNKGCAVAVLNAQGVAFSSCLTGWECRAGAHACVVIVTSDLSQCGTRGIPCAVARGRFLREQLRLVRRGGVGKRLNRRDHRCDQSPAHIRATSGRVTCKAQLANNRVESASCEVPAASNLNWARHPIGSSAARSGWPHSFRFQQCAAPTSARSMPAGGRSARFAADEQPTLPASAATGLAERKQWRSFPAPGLVTAAGRRRRQEQRPGSGVRLRNSPAE